MHGGKELHRGLLSAQHAWAPIDASPACNTHCPLHCPNSTSPPHGAAEPGAGEQRREGKERGQGERDLPATCTAPGTKHGDTEEWRGWFRIYLIIAAPRCCARRGEGSPCCRELRHGQARGDSLWGDPGLAQDRGPADGHSGRWHNYGAEAASLFVSNG